MGHQAALPEVLDIVRANSPQPLRVAAVDALAKIPGNHESASLLASLATFDDDVAKRAHNALVRSPGSPVDDAIVNGIDERDTALKSEYIAAAADRRVRAANSKLMSLASSTHGEIQAAALDAIVVLAGQQEYPELLALIGKLPETLRDTAVKAIRNSGRAVTDSDTRYSAYANAINTNNARVQAALIPGIIEIRMVWATTRAPTSISLLYMAALGVKNRMEAPSSQIPITSLVH